MSINMMMLAALRSANITTAVGQSQFITAGVFSWVCPANVYDVSVVAIGAGSPQGAGGGLGWKNRIPVTPGVTYQVVVGSPTTGTGSSFFIGETTVCGRRGTTIGGTFVGDGGGNGGNVGLADGTAGGFGAGAGGAGGYAGNGGNGGNLVTGGDAPNTSQNGQPGGAGAGGGGGGGGGGSYENQTTGGNTIREYYAGGGAGGTGTLGQGSNGSGGAGGTPGNGRSGRQGLGGSGGISGDGGVGLAPEDRDGGNGGQYGAGGGRLGGRRLVDGASFIGGDNGASQIGALRIIYGAGRAFPSTRTANE